MAISVQQLVQHAAEMCSLVNPGRDVGGNVSAMALKLLNGLLAELNNQEMIASAVEEHDSVFARELAIVKTGDPTPSTEYIAVSQVPDRILGISRRIGDRYVPLYSCNRQQMAQRTQKALPTSFTYEQSTYINNNHTYCRGVVLVDSNRPQKFKVWWSNKIVASALTDTLYLSDMYYDLLLQGLCVKLCDWAKTYEYKAEFDKNFRAAKNLIKRSNQSQRMLQNGTLAGGYDDTYYDGLAGRGW